MNIEKVVNASKKFFGTSLLVGALTVNPFLTKNTQAQSPKLSFYSDFSIKYESGLVKDIKNIPLEVRTLPKKKGGEEIVTIKEDYLELKESLPLSTKLGGKISFNDKIGLTLGMNFDFYFSSKEKNMHTRDFSENSKKCESPREYGPATYYCAYPAFLSNWNRTIKPSLYSEIEAKITDVLGIGVGYELSKEKLVIENGWENSDKFKKNKRYDLANLTTNNIFGSLKFHNEDEGVFYSLDLGFSRAINENLNPLGEQAKINFNDKNWFVGFRIGKSF